MRVSRFVQAALGLLYAAALLAGCNGARTTPQTIPDAPQLVPQAHRAFAHIVIEIQENRSFDNVFAGAAMAKALKYGVRTQSWGYTETCADPNVVTTCTQYALTAVPFESTDEPQHYRSDMMIACNEIQPTPKPSAKVSPCRMNGWPYAYAGMQQPGQPAPTPPATPEYGSYGYLPTAEIQPYITLANSYAMADMMFSSSRSPSFPGHVFLVSGLGVADDPVNGAWSCPGDKNGVQLFTAYQSRSFGKQCFGFDSLVTLIERKHLSWRYYNVVNQDYYSGSNTYWLLQNGLAAIKNVNGNPARKANIVDRSEFFTDIAKDGPKACGLPAVSWLTPNGNASDHAGWSTTPDGPYWIASVYEAIAQSACYKDTALLVVWDDAGGWFDHIAPPFVLTKPPKGANAYRDNVAGFRVPFLFLSAKARPGVSHKPRDFGNILRFVEDNFGLGQLGGEDLDFNGDALQDMYYAKPHPTIPPIPTGRIMLRAPRHYTVRWFLSQPPMPADDE